MKKQIISIEKIEIASFGKAADLLDACFIAIDCNLNINYINDVTLSLLNMNNNNNVLNQPFIAFWDKTKLPALIDSNGTLICKNPMLLHQSFREWKKENVQIEGKRCFFLIGKDISEIESIKKTINSECKKITGHHFNESLSTTEHINEIYNYSPGQMT